MAQLYEASGVAWLTPVEVFAPWYSRALARYILSTQPPSAGPLHVFEIGGGNGTNAKHVLDYIAAAAPARYASASYTVLEISDSLAKRQRETVGARHAGVFRSQVVDATVWPGEGVVHAGPCFVIALEVLDNLPHDKVVWDEQQWWQVEVEKRGDGGGGSLGEVVRPVADALVLQALQLYGTPPVWVEDAPQSERSDPLWLRGFRWAKRVLRSEVRGEGERAHNAAFVPTGARAHPTSPKHTLDHLFLPALCFRDRQVASAC